MDTMITRYLTEQTRHDLAVKMVFMGGPRQVGKTTVATHLRPNGRFTYLNWDIDEHRGSILRKELGSAPLLILDEIHKYRRWRNYLKGIYDAMKTGVSEKREILVTGSARLDLYRFGGDSLQGRYHYLRLMPLSLAEIDRRGSAPLEALFRFGGFPEPFSLQSETETRRWSREYRTRLAREDLRDLEQVQDIGSFELLMGRLPDCVGSPLSINSLREDLQLAHRTVTKWIAIMEKLYAIFRVPPMSGPRIRAVKKEQKVYLFDWTTITNEGARFENMVAAHLLKHVYWLEDSEGRAMELRYFRDTDGREVDFAVLENGKPVMFVECKLGDQDVNGALKYLAARYPSTPAYQIHLRGKKDYQTPEGIRVCQASVLLSELT